MLMHPKVFLSSWIQNIMFKSRQKWQRDKKNCKVIKISYTFINTTSQDNTFKNVEFDMLGFCINIIELITFVTVRNVINIPKVCLYILKFL